MRKGWYKVLRAKIDVEAVKEDLTIKASMFDGETMYCFDDTDDKYLGVPHHYGTNKFGVRKDLSEGNDCTFDSLPDPTHPLAPKGQSVFFNDTLEAVKTLDRVVATAGTGVGKTILCLYVAGKMGKVALVVVPTDALVRQWVDRTTSDISLDLNPSEIGLVQQDTCDYKGKKIVLASMKTLVRREYSDEFYDHFGLILWDEIHKFAADQMSQVLCQFNTRYQLMVTATLKRKDGKDKAIRLWSGDPAVNAAGMAPVPVTYRFIKYKHSEMPQRVYRHMMQMNVVQKQINDLQDIIDDPDTHYSVKSSMIRDKKQAFRRLMNLKKIAMAIYKVEMAKDEKRNTALTNLMMSAYEKDRCILGISDSVKQLQEVHANMIAAGVPEDKICLFVDQLYTGLTTVSVKCHEDTKIETVKQGKGEIEINYNCTIRITKVSVTINGEGLENKKFRNKIINEVQHLMDAWGEVKIKDKMKKVSKDLIEKQLSDKSMRVYLASYGVMEMGIDVPWLDTGFDLTPRTEATQVIGRIARICKGKAKAFWFSLWDEGYPEAIEKTNKKRRKELKGLSYVTVVDPK